MGMDRDLDRDVVGHDAGDRFVRPSRVDKPLLGTCRSCVREAVDTGGPAALFSSITGRTGG
jgi:hypothetical protein